MKYQSHSFMRTLLLSLCLFPSACAGPDGTASDGGSSGDASDVASGADCVTPSGSGTPHAGTIAQDETWTAVASPHLISSDIGIRARVTIEACAVVRVAADKTISVSTNGVLVADGAPTRPVTIERPDATHPWSQLKAQAGGTLRFTYTNVLGGGAPLNAPLDVAAAIDVRGPDQTQPPGETFHADHVLVQDSASQGISVREAGGFSAASTDLVIRGSQNVPIRTWASAAETIPPGTYTGNAHDEIVLEGGGLAAIHRDVTFHDRGVPYRVGDSISEGRLDVDGKTQVATLTVEPGVTIRFKTDGILNVQVAQNTYPATGALVAQGTATAPIIFTSAAAQPTAGDWYGLYFEGLLDPMTQLDFVRVEYAGRKTSSVGSGCRYPDNQNNAAAIRIFVEPPSAAFMTNTTVVASARSGVDRGWLGSAAVSFMGGTNDLSGATMCQETYPNPQGMPCPIPPPCP